MYTLDDLKRGIEGMRGCSGFEPTIDVDPVSGEIILRTTFRFKDKNSSDELVHVNEVD